MSPQTTPSLNAHPNAHLVDKVGFGEPRDTQSVTAEKPLVTMLEGDAKVTASAQMDAHLLGWGEGGGLEEDLS